MWRVAAAAAGLAALTTLGFWAVWHRYLVDFVPLLVILAAPGLWLVLDALGRRPRWIRLACGAVVAGLLAVALLGQVGLSLWSRLFYFVPDRAEEIDATQFRYRLDERLFGGVPPGVHVIDADSVQSDLPPVRPGELLIAGRCDALYIGDFVISFQGWNSSLMAGCATLACMILPVIITASEESLKAVPQGFRDASLALGATRWQTIRRSVLPYSLPGILTSSLLAITRVAGETAPIMFTAAVAAKDDLPWEGIKNPFEILSSQVQALPYHIYTLAARIPDSEYTRSAQYGSVFVFLMLVALMSVSSMVLRAKMRAKLKW